MSSEAVLCAQWAIISSWPGPAPTCCQTHAIKRVNMSSLRHLQSLCDSQKWQIWDLIFVSSYHPKAKTFLQLLISLTYNSNSSCLKLWLYVSHSLFSVSYNLVLFPDFYLLWPPPPSRVLDVCVPTAVWCSHSKEIWWKQTSTNPPENAALIMFLHAP